MRYILIVVLLINFNVFAQTTDLPIISSVSPNKFEVGQVLQELKITGSGFKKDLVVKFSRDDVKVDSILEVDSSYIKCVISVKSNATPGKLDVTVTNPTGESGTGVEAISIISKPVITSVSPKEIQQGVLNKEIRITGSGFMKDAKVEFTEVSSGISVKSINFKSEQEVILIVDVSSNALTLEQKFNFINSDGGMTSGVIRVIPKITIISVTPSVLAQGVLNQEIKINGTNFNKDCQIKVNEEGIIFNNVYIISQTEIVINVNISESVKPGVKEFDIIPTEGVGVKFNLTINPKPSVTSITPNELFQGQENKAITIVGNNFVKESKLSFNTPGIIINSYEVKSKENIVANVSVSDKIESNEYDVIISNPDEGVGVGKSLIKINLKPEITKIIPSSSIQGIFEQEIEICGSGFTKDSKIRITGEGIVINTVNYQSSNSIKISITVASKAPMEFRDIIVSNPDGGTFVALKKLGINKVDKESVYYGDSRRFKKPACVDKKKVFKEHPCYQTIVKENISPDIARYWLIINKINESIREAYKKVEGKYGYDLIGKIGYITDNEGNPVKEIPDITNLVIEQVER